MHRPRLTMPRDGCRVLRLDSRQTKCLELLRRAHPVGVGADLPPMGDVYGHPLPPILPSSPAQARVAADEHGLHCPFVVAIPAPISTRLGQREQFFKE